MSSRFVISISSVGATLALAALSVAAQTPTAKVVSAANVFLATLSDAQRQSVVFSYTDEEQRGRWSNFPISVVRRAGLSFKEMTMEQRNGTMNLLAAALSPRGFEKVQQIMEGDEALKNPQSNSAPSGSDPGQSKGKGKGGGKKGGGGGVMFGKDLYYISILGRPSDTLPWMIQFGGHHLAVNLTIDGARGVLTPTLTGAQPALFTLEGKTIRPLGRESDLGAALLNALDEGQRKQAVLGFRVADLVLGPGQDGKTIQPEGIKASALNAKQRGILLDVIAEWAGIVHEAAATARMIQLKAELNDTWFAWSGPTDVTPGTNIVSYYRIQGPHIVIEYSPQSMGGNPANHIHTMYRDPTNDYGRKPAAK